MIFILSKILILILKPFIWVLVILIFAIATRDKRKRRKCLITALILLLFFSNNALIGKITQWYEPDYPPKQKYDVGIVLGGFSGINKRNNEILFAASGDRLFQAIKLYKQGEIAKILISGGSGNLIDKQVKEADLVIAYLKQIGIPQGDILLENQSRNTIENARFSFQMIRKIKPNAKVLVITSAWHIPRSKLIFDKQARGSIWYYPTNFEGKTEYHFDDFVIPSTAALGQWEMILKEWVGYAVDNIRS